MIYRLITAALLLLAAIFFVVTSKVFATLVADHREPLMSKRWRIEGYFLFATFGIGSLTALLLGVYFAVNFVHLHW